MPSVLEWLRSIAGSRAFKYGLPLVIFVVGGSFGLKEFSKLRYQYSKRLLIRPEDLEPYGIKMKKPGEVTLETEYEKVKSLDIDTWENIRGPRPWEEPPKNKASTPI